MILPRKWSYWRPGLLIPVFFLSCALLNGQDIWLDPRSAGLGACFVSRSGCGSSALNQAGLGRSKKSAVAFHHIRPFITPDLDIASLSAQLVLKNGSPGLTLYSMGITGMRQTSAWISYGMMLHPRVFAGAGIHLRNTGVSREAFYLIEAGYALGIQFLVSDELILGAHVTHPVAWSGKSAAMSRASMMISSGLSYDFYKTARYLTEIHVWADRPLQWCNGLEISISDSILILMGLKNQPWSLSAGLSLAYRKWEITLAASYCLDTGTTPCTSVTYEW